MSADIAVVVPVHNRRALATPCLEAIAREAAASGGIELIVVDQQSTDGITEVARRLGFAIIRSTAPTAGALRNAGVEEASARWVAFIDSDVLVPPGYFQRLRTALLSHPNTLVGCNYGLPDRPHWTERTWDAMTVRRGDGEREWLNAGNMALERTLFVSIGQFDATLSSGEDTELCRRLIAKGIRILQLQSLDAAHLGNPKHLRAFLAKQIWHGQGAPVTDRNSLAGIATFGGYVAALLTLATGMPFVDMGPRIAVAVAVANAVPLLAFGLQSRKLQRRPPIALALPLLHTYFVGRFLALLIRDGRQR